MDPVDQKKNEYEERYKREQVKIIKATVTSLTAIFKRQQKLDDLVLRSCLFVEKLSMSVEVLSAIMKGVIETEVEEGRLPNSVSLQVDSLIKIVSEELDALMIHCRSPSYDPDAPFGSSLVRNTKFYENASQNDN